MKILIGIMYSIENELGECITAINRQTYRNFSLFLVKRLPNKQAHDRLYGTFTEQNAHYDLFLKIDADMVLARTTFLAEVVAYFRQHPDVDNLQVAVFDCICDRLIYGLHVYNRRFRWSATDEPLFVDRRSASTSFKRISDHQELAPAAYHCPNPDCFQSYHYGLHKAIKVLQYGHPQLNYHASMNHWYNLRNIFEHYNRKPSLVLAFVIAGAANAITHGLSAEHIDFDNETTLATFRKLEQRPAWRVRLLATLISRTAALFPSEICLELLLAWRNLPNGMNQARKQMVANLQSEKYRQYERKKRLSA